jgi:hypothetical protein
VNLGNKQVAFLRCMKLATLDHYFLKLSNRQQVPLETNPHRGVRKYTHPTLGAKAQWSREICHA